MKAKTKRVLLAHILSQEAYGEIKEILIKKTLANPYQSSVDIIFKGGDCQGIIELSPTEAKQLAKKINALFSQQRFNPDCDSS